MSPIPPLPAVDPSQAALPGTIDVDAFRSGLASAGAALYAQPDAVGAALMQGIEGFNVRDAQFHSQVQEAIAGTNTHTGNVGATGADAGPGNISDLVGAAATPGSGLDRVMAEGDKIQRRSMGVMMQTYSFALEAQLVTNAATTFTSSINTLVKTQ